MRLRSTIMAVLLVLALPAVAQTPVTGLQQARNFLDRMVRVFGRQVPGATGEAGYGVIVGEQPGAQGAIMLVIIIPDHLVRDPARPEARFAAPAVVFPADPARAVAAQLLDQHLPPAEGDLAVIIVPKPAGARYRPAAMVNTELILAGAPAWQNGRPTDLVPNAVPGRFALRDRAGWLTYEGLDNAPASQGAAVIGERGLIGILVGPAVPERQLTRVLPVDLIAARLRGWGLPWDLAAPEGVSAAAQGGGLAAMTGARAGGGLAASAMPAGPVDAQSASSSGASPAGAAALQVAPLQIVMLLPAEAAARTSWIPPGAKVSPWSDTPVRLFSSPRRESPQIATVPAGRYLPAPLLSRGAYDIVSKIDGGAWFLLEISGQPIGYASGNDVVEVWPMQQTAGLTGGKVLREWTAAAGQVGVLRDVGNAFELETAVTCKNDLCESIVVYTPPPPEPGAIIPTFQVLGLSGNWKRDDVMALRLLVPRRIVETAGTKLYACVGRDNDCDQQTLLPPPAR